jgi:hypothetical protein
VEQFFTVGLNVGSFFCDKLKVTELKKNMAFLGVVEHCSLVEVYRRFRGACCRRDTTETPVNFTAWRKTPEDSYLHTGRRENFKSHKI